MSTWLRTGDVARELGISPVRVRQIADANKIPTTRTVGGYRIFNSEDVERLKEERKRLNRKNRKEDSARLRKLRQNENAYG